MCVAQDIPYPATPPPSVRDWDECKITLIALFFSQTYQHTCSVPSHPETPNLTFQPYKVFWISGQICDPSFHTQSYIFQPGKVFGISALMSLCCPFPSHLCVPAKQSTWDLGSDVPSHHTLCHTCPAVLGIWDVGLCPVSHPITTDFTFSLSVSSDVACHIAPGLWTGNPGGGAAGRSGGGVTWKPVKSEGPPKLTKSKVTKLRVVRDGKGGGYRNPVQPKDRFLGQNNIAARS